MKYDVNYGSLPEPLEQNTFLEYLERYHQGNLEYRELLIIHNIRLAIRRANEKFSNTPYDMNEII